MTHEFARISKYKTLSIYIHLYLTSLARINQDHSNHDVHVHISFEHTCDIDIQIFVLFKETDETLVQCVCHQFPQGWAKIS